MAPGGNDYLNLAGTSAANGERHLHDPAERIADGVILSVDALLYDPQRRQCASEVVAGKCGCHLYFGNGWQACHGHRTVASAAVRPHILGADVARTSATET